MEKLVENMKRVGLTQEVLAKKIKINKIHLNKILKGRASLTKTMAHKIANLDEIDLTEEELMYPKLPLNIIGQFYSGYKVEKYELHRPTIQLANPILPGWFGILHRGNKNKLSEWHFAPNKSWIELYDGRFAEEKIIDPKSIHNYGIVCDDKNDWRCGYLYEKDKKSGTHKFEGIGNTTPKYLKVKWTSMFLGIVNLQALETDFDIHIET
tara:strand:+ start:1710 stop:2339 length:630 start_codon:yes stop_codon:yes gene_type:complete